MGERTVRVKCPVCASHVRRGCAVCGDNHTIPATLADPEAEALMADGERYRAWAACGGSVTPPSSGRGEAG